MIASAPVSQQLNHCWGRITQDKHDHLFIFWRPDMKQYKVVVLEEVPPTTPFDPPFVNASLTPKGGVLQPLEDSYLSLMGGVVNTIHSGRDSSGVVCWMLGSSMLDGKQFGWVTGHRLGAGGVVEKFMSDNGTGLTNDFMVSKMLSGRISGRGSIALTAVYFTRTTSSCSIRTTTSQRSHARPRDRFCKHSAPT
jgi:hypothetical protein